MLKAIINGISERLLKNNIHLKMMFRRQISSEKLKYVVLNVSYIRA